ncbi:MAG: alpha-amylase family glycosyl hydrolase, partial [Aureliella sp.]
MNSVTYPSSSSDTAATTTTIAPACENAANPLIQKLAQRVLKRIQGRARLCSTYRLQFQGAALRFADAAQLADYFKELGVSHIYASPLLKAKSGSTHGYDVVDPTQLNPELGSWEEYGHLVD